MVRYFIQTVCRFCVAEFPARLDAYGYSFTQFDATYTQIRNIAEGFLSSGQQLRLILRVMSVNECPAYKNTLGMNMGWVNAVLLTSEAIKHYTEEKNGYGILGAAKQRSLLVQKNAELEQDVRCL